MEYREYQPAMALRRIVRCYWSLSGDSDTAFGDPEPALPDGSPELIFNLADPFLAVGDHGARTAQPRAMLVGQITAPFAVVPTGAIDLVAVRFEPAGASLLCDHLADLTNGWCDVRALTAAHVGTALQHLCDALPTRRRLETRDGSDADTDAEAEPETAWTDAQCTDVRLAMLNDALMALMAVRPAIDPDVDTAVRAILDSHGTLSLDALASSLGRSMRHLQRRFATHVGISPKQLARIRRFQRVFGAWRDDPRSLSRVAAECGYHDQPHLIRDFRDFAGRAPAAFLANQPEFTQLFLPTNPTRAH